MISLKCRNVLYKNTYILLTSVNVFKERTINFPKIPNFLRNIIMYHI